MKLLVITQKVNLDDDNLGFFHRWIEKLSEKTEKLFVVCLSRGRHNLPANVEVVSLGKEKGFSKLRQFFMLQTYLAQYLPKVDGVFVHMCPIYAVLSCPMAKTLHRKLVLWYVHKSVNFTLRAASLCVDKILTASQESCRLKNRKKIAVVGHGIDVKIFNSKLKTQNSKIQRKSQNFLILSAGRISPVKDQETLIRAVDVLVNQKGIKNINVEVVGLPVEDYEKDYFGKIKSLVKEKNLGNYLQFIGGVRHRDMARYYQGADLLVNLSDTGSLDKTVLEAMACGCRVLTCNEAYQRILPEKYLFRKKDYQHLVEQITALRNSPPDEGLREIIVKNHNLDNLINKVILEFKR